MKELTLRNQHFGGAIAASFIKRARSIHGVIQELELQQSRRPKFETGKPAPKQRLCKHRCDAGGFKVRDAREAENQLLSHDVYNYKREGEIRREEKKEGIFSLLCVLFRFALKSFALLQT